VKRISILGFGVLIVLGGTPARAQDFTAGKTPAQLFSSDCAECHRTPNGLAKNRDLKTLAGFLREHYTTKSDTAGSLAAYVSGFAGAGPADVRNRAGNGPSPPVPGERADRRNRRDNEAAALGEDTGPGAKSPEDQRARRRQRTVNQSGDGEKRRARDDADAPRSPAGVAPAAPSRVAARTGENAPREAADPLSRLRPYLTSGLGFEGTVAEAAKAGHAKSRKRQSKEAGPAPPDAPPPAKAETLPTPPGVPPGATAAAAPVESTATMPALAPPAASPTPTAAAAPAPGTAPAAIVTPPRLGQ
jgi:hypothetical protein